MNAVAPGLVKTHFARALWETDEEGDRAVATRCGASGRRTTSLPRSLYLASDAVVVGDRRDARPRRRDVAGLASGGSVEAGPVRSAGCRTGSSRERRRSSRYATTCLYSWSPSILRSSTPSSRYTGSRPTNASGASVHHQWKSSPPSPQPSRAELGERRDDAPVLLLLVDPTQRELPAHLRLDVAVVGAGAHRVDVERAADATGEPGTVQEDARVLDEAACATPACRRRPCPPWRRCPSSGPTPRTAIRRRGASSRPARRGRGPSCSRSEHRTSSTPAPAPARDR